MQEITNANELKQAIAQLALQQATEYPALKAEVIEISDNLKPINIIKDTLLQIVSTPSPTADLLKAAIIYIVGVVIQKIFFGKSANPLMKLIGTIIEIVFINFMQKKTDWIQLEE